MAKRIIEPYLTYFNSAGTSPLAGGKLYFYEADTVSTNKDTYTDNTLATANPNPIVLDSAGRAGVDVWGEGNYDVVVATSAGVEIERFDDVSGSVTSSSVDTIADMTALLKADLTDGDEYKISGYYAQGDGGGGDFYWDSTSSATANGGTIIASDEGGTGRWLRIPAADLTYIMFGAKGDGIQDDVSYLQEAWASGLPLTETDGTYLMSSGVTVTNDVDIHTEGNPIFRATATMAAMFKITGTLTKTGNNSEYDGDLLATTGIWAVTEQPYLVNVTFRDFTNTTNGTYPMGLLAGAALDLTGENGVGDAYLENVSAINCGLGWRMTGGGQGTGTSTQVNCRTDSLTGSVANIFMHTSFERVSIQGGFFEGDATSAPNVQKTDYVEYIGGTYIGMLRGPTMGANVTNGVVTQPIVKSMSYAAISIDLRRSDNTVPDGHINVIGGEVEDCTRAIFAQCYYLHVDGLISKDTNSSNATYRVTDTFESYFTNCRATGESTYITFQSGDGSAPTPNTTMKFGPGNYTDSTGGSPYDTGGTSVMEFGNSRTVTASGDITMNDDVILVDTSAGTVDLDFPASSQIAASGKRWIIKIVDGTNLLTLSRQSGSGAINNDTIYRVEAGNDYAHLEAEYDSSGAVWVTRLDQSMTASTASLNDIGNAINKMIKRQGSMVYNTGLSKPVWATGSAAGDVWIDATGATTNTPV